MPTLVRISEGALAPSSLFAENNGLFFEIHPPQRRFKWKKQQVDQLWEDIRTACMDDRDTYFLGTLLLAPIEDGRVSVIDGQQRITTLSILLAVLRDYCREFPNFTVRADRLQRLISRVDNDGRPVGSLVVKLQDADNTSYVDLVQQYGSTDLATSQNLLSSAVKRLKSQVSDYISGPNRQDTLRTLCDYVQDKIKLLPLEVRNEGEAYLVFDTTNTRGMRLSPSEALKGRLATIAREDSDLSDRLIKRWNEAAGRLESVGLPIDAMDDYLHAIWSSLEGYTTKRTLDQVAHKLKKLDDLKSFVEDLHAYCDSYLAVVAPAGKASLTEDLKDLKRLNVQSNSFLTMIHKHSWSRFKEAVELVLSLQIRNVTLGPEQANAYEKHWPKWAILVRRGATDQAFDEIRNLMVSDAEFKNAVKQAIVVSSATAAHLLRRLDPISHPNSGVQPMNVDVEHILPKSVVGKLTYNKKLTPNVKEWVKDLGYGIPETAQEAKDLGKTLKNPLYSLGNQALLNDRVNRGAKDLPFSKKKEFYLRQALKLTSTVADNENWRIDRILQRQTEMAEKAPTIWRKES